MGVADPRAFQAEAPEFYPNSKFFCLRLGLLFSHGQARASILWCWAGEVSWLWQLVRLHWRFNANFLWLIVLSWHSWCTLASLHTWPWLWFGEFNESTDSMLYDCSKTEVCASQLCYTCLIRKQFAFGKFKQRPSKHKRRAWCTKMCNDRLMRQIDTSRWWRNGRLRSLVQLCNQMNDLTSWASETQVLWCVESFPLCRQK